MSLGRRSGLHCTRLNEQPTLRARARASMVLATPGTSSTSRCPSQKKAATERRSCCRLPTMTFSTLPTIFDEMTWTLDMRFSRKREEVPCHQGQDNRPADDPCGKWGPTEAGRWG